MPRAKPCSIKCLKIKNKEELFFHTINDGRPEKLITDKTVTYIVLLVFSQEEGKSLLSIYNCTYNNDDDNHKSFHVLNYVLKKIYMYRLV